MCNSKLHLALLGLCLLAGCGGKDDLPAPSARREAPPSSSPTDPAIAWSGKWFGPEGTCLDLAQDGEKYRITIRNLDGARDFHGVRSGNGIAFERDGIRESVRVGSGADTGMKWLADKSDCLVVKSGEGYCRD